MIYFIGQVCGVLATIACVTVPLWKTKFMMLLDATAVNLLMCLNYILIGQSGAAVFVSGVATIQAVFSLLHTRKESEPSRMEKGVFLVLYLIFGVYGLLQATGYMPGWNVKTLVELMPIIGSMLNMCFVYVRGERQSRRFLLLTDGVWALYSAISGATAFFGQFFTVLTTLAAMYRYRNQPDTVAEK